MPVWRGRILSQLSCLYFFTLSDDQIYSHFMAVAEAAPTMPMLLYAFPGERKK